MATPEQIYGDACDLVGPISGTFAALIAARPVNPESVDKVNALADLIRWWQPRKHEPIADPIRHMRNAFNDIIMGRGRLGVSLCDLADPHNNDDPLHEMLLALVYARAALNDMYRPDVDPVPFAGWPAEWRSALPLSTRIEYASDHYGYRVDTFTFSAARQILVWTAEGLVAEDLRRPLPLACIELMDVCTGQLAGWEEGEDEWDEFRYRWRDDDRACLEFWQRCDLAGEPS